MPTNWMSWLMFVIFFAVGVFGPEVWGNMVKRYYKARGPIETTFILRDLSQKPGKSS